MLKPYFQRLAAYNAWANRRLYTACASLADREWSGPRPSFFGSIPRTLNHLLVADRLWLARLEGTPPPNLALDTVLHEALPELRAARQAEDARIDDYCASLDEGELAAEIVYKTVRGQPFANTRALILQHVFNHHTHHRGQVHDMLSATDVAPPPLDLIYFVREAEDQASTNSARA